VLKDNVLLQSGLTFLWDLTDSSVARHKTYFKVSILRFRSHADCQHIGTSQFYDTLLKMQLNCCIFFSFIIAAVESRGVAGGGGSAADRLSRRIIPGNDVGHRQGTVKSHRISQFVQ